MNSAMDEYQKQERLLEIDDELTLVSSMEEFAGVINAINEVNGWNVERSEAEWAILAVTEIAEAFEEWRNGKPLYYKVDGKPEGLAAEYADTLIRILHWFIQHDINVDEVVREKLRYNMTRGHRHGGKKA